MSTVVQGLYVTAVGMGLVFLSLGILLVLMIVLQRIFPKRAEEPVEEEGAAAAQEPMDAGLSAGVVAAISVALARAQADESRAYRPTETLAGAQAWSVAGRTRQLHHPRAREKKQ